MNNTVIKTSGLTKIFGTKKVVSGISFEVLKNTIFGILGPNGSGKTTTLRMLATILSPTSGSIEIEGLDYINNAQEIRQNIGYVPQKDALYLNLSVWENVDFFFSAYKYDGNRNERISETLKMVDLLGSKAKLVKNLSGGMAKRLSIACAIVHKPQILFFDEATMGLDPVAREKIWQLTFELKKTATIITTTHYMDEAQTLCDQLIILREGKIIIEGSPEQIIARHRAKNLQEVLANI
ncbi:MAG: ABC transporter ATP-binding protein [Patescibacteria group bacterium]